MLELFALMFVFAVLLKLTIYLFMPQTAFDAASFFSKRKTPLMFLFAVLAIASGYVVLTQLTAVQVGAVMFFYSALMGLSFVNFGDEFLTLRKKFFASKEKMLFSIIVWAALALWLLYAIVKGS